MRRARQFEHWLIRSGFLLGCSCAALGGTETVARAQGSGSANSADSDALKLARDQFNQALSLQTGGDWAGALALLKEVAAVKPTPQVRFNIAICEEQLGRLVAALGDYELAASDAQAQKADQVGQEVDARLEALKARVPRVVVQRGEGADSATISLDGVSLGDSVLNQPMPADPGPHVVEAKAAGFLPFKESFRVAEQQTATILVKLEPEPTPLQPIPPPAARPAQQSTRTIGFVVGGVGIASLIGSGAMFLLRQSTISDLDKQCGPSRNACPDSEHNTVDRGKLYTTLGDVTLAVGAVGLGVGAALVIAGGHSPEQASLAVAPGAANANAGATLLGRF
ncbi:MAG TPA: hypothetical protein VHV51_17810 [Polyangiaceae bacterium]|jgi:tetratricopeptide (TPR) repeat protein|nr:hypothetical protein [Polyangiaceae bacterium]